MQHSDIPPDLWLELEFVLQASVRDFIKDNFGLYHPPGDYRALREENLRRSKNPKFVSEK